MQPANQPTVMGLTLCYEQVWN